MHRILLASTALAFVATPALADKCFDKGTLSYVDCPQPAAAPAPAPIITPAPYYNWTGFYIGAHAGIADMDIEGLYNGDPVDFSELSDNGFLAGGQIGYNYKFANDVVLGLEVDASWIDIDDSLDTAPGVDTEYVDYEVEYSASVQAKLGYALGSVMPYVKGGVGLVSYEVFIVDEAAADPTVTFKDDETVFAPVVGAGLDFLVTDHWVVGADFNYFFVDEDVDLGPALEPDEDGGYEVGPLWTARLKASYKF